MNGNHELGTDGTRNCLQAEHDLAFFADACQAAESTTVTAAPTAGPEPAAAVLAVTLVVTLAVTLAVTLYVTLAVAHAVTLAATLNVSHAVSLAVTLDATLAVTHAVTLAGSDHSGQSLDAPLAQSWQQQQQVVELVALHTLAADAVDPAFANPGC